MYLLAAPLKGMVKAHPVTNFMDQGISTIVLLAAAATSSGRCLVVDDYSISVLIEGTIRRKGGPSQETRYSCGINIESRTVALA